MLTHAHTRTGTKIVVGRGGETRLSKLCTPRIEKTDREEAHGDHAVWARKAPALGRHVPRRRCCLLRSCCPRAYHQGQQRGWSGGGAPHRGACTCPLPRFVSSHHGEGDARAWPMAYGGASPIRRLADLVRRLADPVSCVKPRAAAGLARAKADPVVLVAAWHAPAATWGQIRSWALVPTPRAPTQGRGALQHETPDR